MHYKSLSLILTLTLLSACTTVSVQPPSGGAAGPGAGPLPSPGPGASATPRPGSSAAPTGPGVTPSNMPSSTPNPSSSPSPGSGTQVVKLPNGSQLTLSIAKRNLTAVGETIQLRFELKDAQGQPLSTEGLTFVYSSSRPQDFAVDTKGLITALVASGSSTITVQVAGTQIQISQVVTVGKTAGNGGGGGGGGTGGGTTPRAQIAASHTAITGLGSLVKLTGSAQNFSSGTLTYSWSCVETDCGTFTSSNTAESYWQAPATAGVYTLQLTITGGSQSAQSSRQITFSTGSSSATTGLSLSPGTIWYVNDTASGDNDGSSWVDAFTDLQSALTRSQAGDLIYVAEGVYRPTSGTNRSLSFRLKPGVKIYGSFDDNEPAPSPAGRNILDGSVLTGDIGRPDDAADNSYHVVYNNEISAASGTELNGFQIRDGNADGTGFEGWGGGMLNFISSPILVNITFYLNTAAQYGGAMYNANGSRPALTDVSLIANTAQAGGAIYNTSNSHLTLTKTALYDNEAESGGAVYNLDSNATFTNVVFSKNHADLSGGGLFNQNSNLSLTNTTFSENTAGTSGGGISNISSTANLVNNLFYLSAFDNLSLSGESDDGDYRSYDNGNVVIEDGQGASFFTYLADPNGIDNLWRGSDDGLNLKSGVGFYNHGTEVGNIIDITGASRSGYTTPGAYQAQP